MAGLYIREGGLTSMAPIDMAALQPRGYDVFSVNLTRLGNL
jgi:hypothetical protein